MTQKELATIVAATTQSVISALTQSGIIGEKPSVPQSRKRSKADSTSNAIDDIMADASDEALAKGKKLAVPEGEAIIMEYSDKQLAVWGDTKPYKDILKKFGAKKWGIIWGYIPEGEKEENKAEGWYISKSALSEAGGEKSLLKALRSAGLSVSYGESLKAKTEAHRASKRKEADKPTATAEKSKAKKANKPTKVVAMPTPTFEGVGHTPKGCIKGEFAQFVENPDLFIHTEANGRQSAYICIGESKGGDTQFLLITNKVKGAEIENYDRIAKIASLGLPCAISEGIVTKVAQWQIDAFKESDAEAYKWMIKNTKAA